MQQGPLERTMSSHNANNHGMGGTITAAVRTVRSWTPTAGRTIMTTLHRRRRHDADGDLHELHPVDGRRLAHDGRLTQGGHESMMALAPLRVRAATTMSLAPNPPTERQLIVAELDQQQY
jgi:hypothetical protein